MAERYQAITFYLLMCLASEGWLPVVENKPEYNADTQELSLTSYTIGETQITVNYVAVAKTATLDERLTTLETTEAELLETILPSLMV
jgi:hypothetical protein